MASTAFANEVTETKHNNKNDADAATTTAAAAAATLGAAEDKRGPVTLSSADNDKVKNGIGGSIGNARENYKFDVST